MTVSAAVAHGRAVTRLDLQDFRNYAALRLSLGPRPVVLTGLNGAGKTNLLEALSLLSPGRGLRRARIADLARRVDKAESGRAWAVAARLDTDPGQISVGIGRVAGDGDRRTVRIDGAPVRSQATLADVCSVVWLTPEMDRLFADGSGGRRRFLDRLVFGLDPTHARRVAGYERTLRERAQGLRSGVADATWLSALESRMAQVGVEIALARRRAIDDLNAVAAGAPAFPRFRLTLAGTLEGWLEEAGADAGGARLAAALAASRARDREAGGASHGAHRSDWRALNLDNAMPAAQCSTGEQKAVLVCIVLAHAHLLRDRFGVTPIVLLDEVAAHLDARRRAALYAALRDFGAQAWMTGTDRALFDGLDGHAQFFEISDGIIAERSDHG